MIYIAQYLTHLGMIEKDLGIKFYLFQFEISAFYEKNSKLNRVDNLYFSCWKNTLQI